MQRCTMSRQAGLDLQCENPDDDLGAIRPADYGTRSAIMMSEATLHIRKATGELVPFDEMRLRSALERSGAGALPHHDHTRPGGKINPVM